MANYAYNNAKNVSTGHTPFDLNCDYHPRILYKEDVNLCFQLKLADELSVKLKELIIVCRKNFHNTQEFQKRAHNKGVKPRSYVHSEKVWLNIKYIKTKRNRKLEAQFFICFRYSILSESRRTSWSFLRNIKFMMLSICYY